MKKILWSALLSTLITAGLLLALLFLVNTNRPLSLLFSLLVCSLAYLAFSRFLATAKKRENIKLPLLLIGLWLGLALLIMLGTIALIYLSR